MRARPSTRLIFADSTFEQGMVTLITGATGFLGSYVTECSLNAGEATICYSNSEPSRPWRSEVNPIIVSGDISDQGRITDIIRERGVSRIIHLAGIISSVAQKNPSTATLVNCEGTMRILEAARLTGITRVVFASSTQVYGATAAHDSKRLLDEETTPDPLSVYGATKLFGEKLGLNYADMYGIDFIALRIAPCYGFGNVINRAQLVDNRVERTQKIIEYPMVGRPVRIERGGLDPMDFVYVEAAAESIFRATMKAKLEHRIYLISSGELHCMEDFKNALKNYIPDADVQIGGGSDPLYRPSPAFSIARAQRELGHNPGRFGENIEKYIRIAQSESRKLSG